MKVKKFLDSKYLILLGCICLFAFVSRLYRVGDIQGYVFDEVYHAITAKLIHRNDPRAYEWWNPPVEVNTAVDWLHPPLAKYTQAFGMFVFGETPLGWRISAVFFGTGVIFLTAELARFLFKNKALALLAALLASFDGLLLTQSRIAMNDIHVTFFILLAMLCYAWYRTLLEHKISAQSEKHVTQRRLDLSLVLAGVVAGTAMGTKWSGLFALTLIWIWESSFLLTRLQLLAPSTPQKLRQIFKRVGALVILPFVVYVLSYTHMFLQGKTLVCLGNSVEQGKCYCDQTSSSWVNVMKTISGGDGKSWEALEARGGCKRLISHFSELHNQIWWYQTTLKATHAYQSRPLQWFLDLRPVWFYVNYGQNTTANIYAQGNPLLFWIGDVFVLITVGVLSVQAATVLSTRLKTKKYNPLISLQQTIITMTNVQDKVGRLFFLTIAYFIVWLPWEASPRIMFFYHYTPAIPLLAILLAYWLVKLSKYPLGKILLVAAVFVIGITFFIFYPNWTGLPVPTQFANTIYFALKSWK